MKYRISTVTFLVLAMICITGGSLYAQTQWSFTSTNFSGTVNFDDSHAQYAPGGTCLLNSCITSYVFTNTATGGVFDSANEGISGQIDFGATVSPNDLTNASFLAIDLFPPNGDQQALTIAGSQNGSLAINDFSNIDTNGLFVPEPTSAVTALLGLLGFLALRRRS